ncbi:hypothetical protein HYZ06_00770 [Candidatus Daviesbacteria bacterium]|nr:hypothetical protein [Candidatus Daviesbacteria bacterium]
MPQLEVRELGQKFYPFQLPTRDEWEIGYALPAWRVSEIVLRTAVLPDLLFRTVLKCNPDLFNEENIRNFKDLKWQLYLEADKKQLRELGLIHPYTMQPATFHTTELDARHVFTQGSYSPLKRLRVQVYQPGEGVYESKPSEGYLRQEGEVQFRQFYPVDQPNRKVVLIEDPNDQERLSQIWAKFLLDERVRVSKKELADLQKLQGFADRLAQGRYF